MTCFHTLRQIALDASRAAFQATMEIVPRLLVEERVTCTMDMLVMSIVMKVARGAMLAKRAVRVEQVHCCQTAKRATLERQRPVEVNHASPAKLVNMPLICTRKFVLVWEYLLGRPCVPNAPWEWSLLIISPHRAGVSVGECVMQPCRWDDWIGVLLVRRERRRLLLPHLHLHLFLHLNTTSQSLPLRQIKRPWSSTVFRLSRGQVFGKSLA